jgi:two-component system nitrogen regulation response regulator GlnG
MAPGQNIEIKDLPPELKSVSESVTAGSWFAALEREAAAMLARGETGIIDGLTRQFEKSLIVKALQATGGRRIEAAGLLGLGRNTLTRKIQELGLDKGREGPEE